MKSKRLKELSVNDLKKYLKKERKDLLTNKKRKYILQLINNKQKQNIKLAEKIVNSKIYKLAKLQLKRKGKGVRIKIGELICYDYPLYLLINTMIEIKEKLTKK